MSDEKQPQPPRNEHELELRLVRLLGNDNVRMLSMRTMMANTIAGQFLPSGAILKGGGSLRFRFGSMFTRNTYDFDATRRGDLEDFLKELRESLARGWNGFTGEIAILPQASPKGVPFDYVMQPVDVKLRYKNNSWCKVSLEISHNEAGAADESELVDAPVEVLRVFRELGFPAPSPVALITMEHQLAQKLHGASDPSERNGRAHDLIDIQLIMRGGSVDLAKVGGICRSLFPLRRRQLWPAPVVVRDGWGKIYEAQSRGLDVLPTVEEAAEWVNGLIERIVKCDEGRR